MTSSLFPQGFLGTRADVLLDIIVIAVTLVPFILIYSFQKVRSGNHSIHSKIQTLLFFVVLTAVVLFEVNIRISGGSGSLLQGSAFAGNEYFRIFLWIHIAVATLTYSGWGFLLLISNKKWTTRLLPGEFSVNHKKWGKIIFAGACFTSFSGLVVYILGFAL